MAKIIVIGGGFGGLSFLQKARKSKNEFILIDKTNHQVHNLRIQEEYKRKNVQESRIKELEEQLRIAEKSAV